MVKIDRCVSGLDGKCHSISERFPYFSTCVLAQLTRLLAIFPAVLDQELARACIGENNDENGKNIDKSIMCNE